jgi:hypothetical protein
VEEENCRLVYPLKGVPVEKLDSYQKEIFKKCKLIRPAYMPVIGVETYQDMNIVSTLPKYIKPKNVGLMFFSMDPDKLFQYTQIDVVQFPSGLGGDDIIEKTFKGSIQQQLRDAL